MKLTAKIEIYKQLIKHLTTGSSKPDISKLPKEVVKLVNSIEAGLLDISYKYGKLTISIGDKAYKLTESEINKALNKLSISSKEAYIREASNKAQELAIDRLFDKLSYKAYEIVSKGNKTQSVGSIVSDLRESTQDFTRDWHRVAITSIHNSMIQGKAQEITDNYGTEARVYKRPAPNCCPHCEKAYLVAGTRRPKVFKLSELIANDTNYGRKSKDWLPVLGTMHPNCLCQLMVLPEGFELDDNGNTVSVK